MNLEIETTFGPVISLSEKESFAKFSKYVTQTIPRGSRSWKDFGWYSSNHIAKLWSIYRLYDKDCLNRYGSPNWKKNLNKEELEEQISLILTPLYEKIQPLFHILSIKSNDSKVALRFFPTTKGSKIFVIYLIEKRFYIGTFEPENDDLQALFRDLLFKNNKDVNQVLVDFIW